MVYIIMNQTTCLGDYKYYETDKLIFAKVPKEHRGERTVGSRSGSFSSGYRGGILQIFRQQFLLVFLGLFFNYRPYFRSYIHSQCGLFFIKNIGFCIFQQCESKKRIACVIYLCSIVGIVFLFYYFVFYVGYPYGEPIVFRWRRYSVDLAWELQPDICMPPMDSRDFISFGCYFTGGIYLSDCHFNCFQRKHAVF